MWGTFVMLLPAAAWGAVLYGARVLLVVGVSVLSFVAVELVVSLPLGRLRLKDGSAALSGLMFALLLPPGIHPALLPVGAIISMLVIKGLFGGIGANWLNPALGSYAVFSIAFPDQMNSFRMPRLLSELPAVDGLSAATPLSVLGSAESRGLDAVSALELAGYPVSSVAQAVSETVNSSFLGNAGSGWGGIAIPPIYIDLMLGFRSGAIGEASVILLLAISIPHLARRGVRAEIAATILAGFAAVVVAFGGTGSGGGLFSGDLLFHLSTGGVLLGSFFFALDPVTTPMSRLAGLVYATLIGLMAGLLRVVGFAAGGIGLAILFANLLVQPLNELSTLLFNRKRKREFSQ
jgi:electron transport complex protein RnfD